MSTAVKEKKVSDMTVRELNFLIKEPYQEIITPNYGLKLRHKEKEY